MCHQNNNRKITVVEVINQIVDAGAETIVKDLMINLDTNKFNVYLITECASSIRSANVRALLGKNIQIQSLFPTVTNIYLRIIRRFLLIILPASFLYRLRYKYISKKLLKINPDIVHVHLHMLEYIYPIAKFLPKSTIIYSNYTLPSRYFNNDNMKEYLYMATDLVKNNSMRFTAMHEEMKSEINLLFKVNNTVILRNGIDLSSYKQDIDKNKARESIGVPINSFVIGHLGRFVYIKNHSFLVDVFLEVLKQRNNAFLLMVGQGKDRKMIERKIEQNNIQKRCLILSSVDDLYNIYKAMDVFVFPSLFEGIPNACIEAQAAGLKCIISSSITKDVFFSENAIEANLNDPPKEWAQKILDDHIKGVYHNDITCFDMKAVIRQVEDLYKDILE